MKYDGMTIINYLPSDVTQHREFAEFADIRAAETIFF